MDFKIPDAGVLVALVALLATILYRPSAARRRDFEILLSRSDKEAEKREQAMQALFERFDEKAAERERVLQADLDRSDRNFETPLTRSNKLMKGLAGVA